MTNILNLIQSQLPPQASNQISGAVGESLDATKAAFEIAVPAILGSLVSKVNASPDGATQVFNLLNEGQNKGGADFASGASGGAGIGQQLTGNSPLLNTLLGSKLGGVSDFIAGHSGIKGRSALPILEMTAPLVVSLLGKHVASEGLDAAAVGQLLNSQTEHLKNALPSGLANTLGIGSFLHRISDTTKIPTRAASSKSGSPSYIRATIPPTTSPRGNALKWAAALLALAALGLWAVSHRGGGFAGAGGTRDDTHGLVGHTVNAPTPTYSNVNLPPVDAADEVAKAITNGDRDQKINLDGLSFDSTGHPAGSANGEMQRIELALSAAPTVKVTITGYGNTQAEGVNQASGIKSVFVSSGIAADRILTQGEAGSGVPSMRLMQ